MIGGFRGAQNATSRCVPPTIPMDIFQWMEQRRQLATAAAAAAAHVAEARSSISDAEKQYLWVLVDYNQNDYLFDYNLIISNSYYRDKNIFVSENGIWQVSFDQYGEAPLQYNYHFLHHKYFMMVENI